MQMVVYSSVTPNKVYLMHYLCSTHLLKRSRLSLLISPIYCFQALLPNYCNLFLLFR